MIEQAPCFNCGAPSAHDHHVVPRSRGGIKTVPLCESCHGKAHHRSGAMRTSDLTRRALQAKKRRGELVGNAPFGSSVAADGVHLVVNAKEQETIACVRALRAEGMSLRAIVAALAAAGLVGRTGKPFALRQVALMVKTPKPMQIELHGVSVTA